MVFCFLLSLSMNNISSSVVPFQTMKICVASNCVIKILAYTGAQVVLIAHPMTCR